MLLFLSACGSRDERRPGPPPPTTREFQRCTADLLAQGVRFRALPDQQFGGGCSAAGAVQLLDIGTPVNNLGAMRCGLAGKFASWVRFGAVPAARQILGSEIARIDSFGSYACRNVVGAGGPARLSGHGLANAVDIGGFVLADGRRINVLGGWTSPDPAVQAFLRTVRKSACRRFGTVLSPDYNAAHANHLHLEDDEASFCR
ncbi:MAG: extensin family protein [Pseudomonadota bacterium]